MGNRSKTISISGDFEKTVNGKTAVMTVTSMDIKLNGGTDKKIGYTITAIDVVAESLKWKTPQ